MDRRRLILAHLANWKRFEAGELGLAMSGSSEKSTEARTSWGFLSGADS